MKIPLDQSATAIVCDRQGVITRVVHDELGIAHQCAAGNSLVEIFDPESREKAGNFLGAVQKNGGAFDWQLCMQIREQITLLHCMGFNDAGEFWIILAQTQMAAARALEEMSLIQSEQHGMLRAALKYAGQVRQATKTESQFEELTKLYNDLGRTQRDLSQKNAELEEVRTQLEAKLKLEQAYNELSQSKEKLETMVQERTAELSRVSEGLRYNELRYRSLVEATTAVTWNTAASGEVEAELPGWTAFTGQTFEQLRGRGWLDAIHPDDRAYTFKVWSAAHASQSTCQTEHRVRRHDGQYRNMMARGVPIMNKDGKIIEWIGAHIDVTEQRRAEEAMRIAMEATKAANAKLDALATTDGLTGIANRRTFQSWLEAESARSARYGLPLSLVMLDVDHFKSLNDTFGHQAGDDILKQLARLLTAAARTTDLIARFGGEEFAIILVNTDKYASTEVGERIRARIEAEIWPHRQITASIGIATRGPGADSPTELIGQADKALYFCKNHGRNRSIHSLDIVPAVAPVTPV